MQSRFKSRMLNFIYARGKCIASRKHLRTVYMTNNCANIVQTLRRKKIRAIPEAGPVMVIQLKLFSVQQDTST